MRIGEGVEWAIHCATLLAILPPDGPMTGARLAEFHQVPGAYLAKSLQALSRAGIIESLPGRNGGYRLARPARDITLLDIVLAVEGDEPAFRCTEIRRRGPGAMPARKYLSPCGIASAMWRAEEAWRAELAAVTVADMLDHVMQSVTPESAAKTVAWIQEVL